MNNNFLNLERELIEHNLFVDDTKEFVAALWITGYWEIVPVFPYLLGKDFVPSF